MSFPLPGDMPALNLNIPLSKGKASNIELNETLLKHWVEKLPTHDLSAFIDTCQHPLSHSNCHTILPHARLKMLEVYRQPINQMIFDLSPSTLCQQARSIEAQNKLVESLMALNHELCVGYKVAIMTSAIDNPGLAHNAVGKMAIHRAIEQLSFLALLAYKFHRQPLAGTFQDLHQLFLSVLQAGISDETPNMNLQHLTATGSYRQRYIQIMMLGICDPFGLQTASVVRAYRMTGQLAVLAELDLHNQQSPAEGVFYINCLSDRLPEPSILAATPDKPPPLLTLNTKKVLNGIERLLQQASQQSSTIDTALIHQITPYLNTAYQRKQPRTQVTGARQACVIRGFAAIHGQIGKTRISALDSEPYWQIINKNDYGYLLVSDSFRQILSLSIGDLIAITERLPDNSEGSTCLATIQWLRLDRHGQTKLGVALLQGVAKPIHFRLDAQDNPQPALLIPESIQPPLPASIICLAGLYKPGQQLRLQSAKKFLNFSITCTHLLEKYGDSERFSIRYCD